MTGGLRGRVRAFYRTYLPVGDRIGEMFYATWMVVVSLGIINSVEDPQGIVPLAIAISFAVNITWGLIDGISVMLSGVIDRAKDEEIVYDLRTSDGPAARGAAHDALKDTIVGALGREERDGIIDQIARGAPGEDPRRRPHYAGRAGWYYALGILAIDVFLVFPIVAPLLVVPDVHQAVLVSRLIATLFFAALGVAYARNLNRSKVLAALFLGTLGFSVFSLAYLLGW